MEKEIEIDSWVEGHALTLCVPTHSARRLMKEWTTFVCQVNRRAMPASKRCSFSYAPGLHTN